MLFRIAIPLVFIRTYCCMLGLGGGGGVLVAASQSCQAHCYSAADKNVMVFFSRHVCRSTSTEGTTLVPDAASPPQASPDI